MQNEKQWCNVTLARETVHIWIISAIVLEYLPPSAISWDLWNGMWFISYLAARFINRI